MSFKFAYQLNTIFSVHSFIRTILICRNYDSTASLDAFCVEEGINSLNIDEGQGIEDTIEDISSIIDTGKKMLSTSLISTLKFDNLVGRTLEREEEDTRFMRKCSKLPGRVWGDTSRVHS